MRLVYITLGWATGMILANTADLPPETWFFLSLLMAIGVAFGWASRDYRIINIALLALTIGGFRYALVPTTSDIAQYNLSGGLTITGIIIDDPDIRDDRVQFRVDTETFTQGGQTSPTSGLVLVRAPRTTTASYGDRVNVAGSLITPGEFDTFSYADFLARQGIYSIMTDAAIETVSSGHGIAFYSAIFDLRRTANDAINQALPEPQAGLLSGILLGNERGIAPELEEDFSRVGASHVIAISGFNMVIIAGVVMSLLSTNQERPPVWAALVGLTIVAFYTLLVGANAAVVRAAIMSGVLIIGQVLDRRTYVPTSLAFVALLMSIHDPNVFWDISFQLSFFATLGLALFVTPLTVGFDSLLFRFLPASWARTTSNFLSEPLIVTIAAQIFTLPLILLYFNRLSIVTIIVNLLIVPVQTPLLLFGGFATILALIIPALAQIIFWIDMVLLGWTIGVVRLFAQLPFADVEFRVPARLIALYFVVMIGWALMHATQPRWWLWINRQIRRQALLTTLIISGSALVILIGAIWLSRPDDHLDVWFLDVGHSNGVLIETPNGAHILVDGGRFPSRLLTALGDRLPFTDRTIEVLIITQPDAFDYAALPPLLARYTAGVAITNGQPNLSEAYLQLQDSLAETDIVEVTAGYAITTDDGVTIEVLHPQTQPTLGDTLDDGAIVLRVSYGEVSFLIASDLSAEAQQELLDNGEFPLATVLQLPQHGTARSLNTDFLNAVQPQAIVLQSDPANRRGDPAPQIIDMLPDVPLLRTDERGTIHMWTDGENLWTEDYN